MQADVQFVLNNLSAGTEAANGTTPHNPHRPGKGHHTIQTGLH